jgi:hypothetical protein
MKKVLIRLLPTVVAALGVVAASAYVLMLVLSGLGISFSYLNILGVWSGILILIVLTRLGKIIWEYLAMTFTMFITTRKLRKDLAEKQDILDKHFKIFSNKPPEGN